MWPCNTSGGSRCVIGRSMFDTWWSSFALEDNLITRGDGTLFSYKIKAGLLSVPYSRDGGLYSGSLSDSSCCRIAFMSSYNCPIC